MKDLMQLESEIASISARRQELFALKAPIDAELLTNYETLNDLHTEFHTIVLAQPRTREEDIKLFLANDRDETAMMCRARSNFWFKQRLGSSGRKETGQTFLSVAMVNGDGTGNFAKLNVLLEVLPFVIADADGFKSIGITEKNLCSNGIYSLAVGPEHVEIRCFAYGRDRDSLKFDDLASALEYVSDNLYYMSAINYSELDCEE